MNDEIKWQAFALIIGIALIGFGARGCALMETGSAAVCVDHCFPLHSRVTDDRCECLVRGGR